MANNDKPLTGKSSIGDWLNHAVGGPLIREMLAKGGQDESALKPVRLFSLQRMVALSKGQLSQEAVDGLVAAANGGVTPAAEADDDDVAAPGTWTERLTTGRFAGQTVIVIGAGAGAGSGIGRATASPSSSPRCRPARSSP